MVTHKKHSQLWLIRNTHNGHYFQWYQIQSNAHFQNTIWDLFYMFHYTLGPIPQIPQYIVTNSTASIIDWDLFHSFDNWLGPIPQLQQLTGTYSNAAELIGTYSTASIIDCDLFYCFDNWLGPIPQLPWLIGTYSTASIIDWDLFQCLIIYFVTLSTDATFCDLRHNCISKINSHLWNRAQFLVEIITILFVTYSTMLYIQFHNFK